MSLYNMTQGVDRFSKVALLALHQSEEITEKIEFGRLRDAFLEKEDDTFRVRVHTRNGGGNRSEYQSIIDTLRQHPWFSFDEDCSHDSTYADFVFTLPDELANEITEQLSSIAADELWKPPVDHEARFQAVLDSI